MSDAGGNVAADGCVSLRSPRRWARAEVVELVRREWALQLGSVPSTKGASFLESGGTSITAVALLVRLNRALGIQLPLDTILRNGTVDKLSEFVLRHVSDEGALGRDQAEDVTSFFCPGAAESAPVESTELQQAYWAGDDDSFEHGRPAFFYEEYHAEDLDVARLEQALASMVERHPALRTVFDADSRQRVLPLPRVYRPSLVDCRDSSEAASNRLLELRRAILEKPLKLNHWPLFDFTIARLPKGHRLFFKCPLAILDGMSWEIFSRELHSLYLGRELPSGGGFRFADYARSLRALRASERHARAERFWDVKLESLAAAPELPKPLAARRARAPSLVRLSRCLPRATWAAFREKAESRGVTASGALACGFGQVLATWSQSPRFTLNVMHGNRVPFHPAVERSLGCFADTLLVDLDFSAPGSFADSALRVQSGLFEALANSTVSGIGNIRRLRQRWGATKGAVMPVVFASGLGIIPDGGAYFFDKFGWRRCHAALSSPQVTLDHQVYENRGTLMLNWDFAPDAFPDGVIPSMFEAYVGLLERLSRTSAAWDGDSPALTPEEHRAKRWRVNATATPEPMSELLHAGFSRQAGAAPEQVGLMTSSGRRFSYGELSQRAREIASIIQRKGVRRGELVAVYADKGWEQVVAVLGILLAGGAYLPLSRTSPPLRLQQILNLARVRHVVASAEAAQGVPPGHQVTQVPEEVGTAPVAALPRDAEPSDLAYVIFTSGSTGTPKGVAITHAAASNTILDMVHRFGLGPSSRVLGISELNFDLSVFDLFGTFCSGGTLVLPGPNETRDPARLASIVHRHQVSVWNSVPAFVEMLCAEPAAADAGLLASLKVFLLSGDWIPLGVPPRLRALVPHARLVALGGATEASIWSNYYEVDRVAPDWKSVPYGFPLANQQLWVLDSELEIRPDWVAGELYIGGAGVALGYLEDPEQTAARFIDTAAYGRIYRTGDVARVSPDGWVEFLGRRDTQVKVRGHRIELGDIEACIEQHPGVSRCQALVCNAPGGGSIVAFYVTRPQHTVSSRELEELSMRGLDPYAHPSTFVELRELPLTTNGKVDRAALLREAQSSSRRASLVPPVGRTETKLLELWRSVLGNDHLGADDGFFGAGGHSLTAVQLMARIDGELGKRLPISTLYGHDTVRSLARRIDDEGESAWSCKLRLTQSRGAPTIVLLHPVGGNVLCYSALGKLLERFPVLAFQSRGWAADGVAHTTVEAMAAHYVEAIVAEQLLGPVLVVGWSMGGVIGLEVTRLLAERRISAELVAIDSWAAARLPSAFDPLRAFYADLCSGHFDPDASSAEVSWQSLHDEYVRQVTAFGDAHAAVPIDEARRLYEVYAKNTTALQRYTPRELDFPVHLIRAAKARPYSHLIPLSEVLSELGVPPVEDMTLAADHYTILEAPFVHEVAELIAAVAERLVSSVAEKQSWQEKVTAP